MAEEEHLLATRVSDNSPEAWNPPHPPLCYELRLVQPVQESRSLRLRFNNYYVHEISVKAVFEQDDTTRNFSLIDGHTLMLDCHTEGSSQDRFRLDLELPESPLCLSKLLLFCSQPSQTWSVWRLDDISLASVLRTDKSVHADSCVQSDVGTLGTIKSLMSVIQSNITSSKGNAQRKTVSSKIPPAVAGPCYNIQLLLYNQMDN